MARNLWLQFTGQLTLVIVLTVVFVCVRCHDNANHLFTLGNGNTSDNAVHENILKTEQGGSRRECEPFNENHLKFFISLFVIISFGAISRRVLKATGLQIPYTVLVMITGIFLGLATFIIAQSSWSSGCEAWSKYTRISRMPPQILLYVFLPILLLEPALTLNPHILIRSIVQILVISVPGMLIATFVLAVICQYIFIQYEWDFIQASLFGAMISATDPVAVVSIFKEMRAPEVLNTLIRGESLINTGVSILLFQIFVGILTNSYAESQDGLALEILKKTAQIALGGPAFGYAVAKITSFLLSIIFNDAIVEITLTIVAAYLTYYVGDAYLKISGIVPVVALGLALSAEKTSISPKTTLQFRHFWHILYYLANTILFTLVGIAMAETSLNSFQLIDLVYLAILYLVLIAIRAVVLISMTSLLRYLGYGFTWRYLVLTTWSGYRGAIGLCLALHVFNNPDLCHLSQIGSKFLFLTAGIVFLTVLINGSTTQALLDLLGLTKIPMDRLQNMKNAYKQILGTQMRTIAELKHNRFVGDAMWELVAKYTTFDNPYAKLTDSKLENPTNSRQPITARKSKILKSNKVSNVQENPSKFDLIQKDYSELTEQVRLNCLKALQSSLQRQFEDGFITKRTFKILTKATLVVQDKPLCLIEAKDLNKYWTPHGGSSWLKSYLTKKVKKFPGLIKKLDVQISKQIFEGYEIAQGFSTALDDVIGLLPQMTAERLILTKFTTAFEQERLEIVKEMGILQNEYPGVAIAHKTRQACRAVLNHMQEILKELHENGLMDDKENKILVSALEDKIKRLKTLPLFSVLPEKLLEDLPFVTGNDAMLAYIKKHAKLVSFAPSERIFKAGDDPNGILVIASGIVKEHYIPKDDVINKYKKHGAVPNTELLRDLTFTSQATDFLTTGAIIGEKGLLTGQAVAATAISQSQVTAYYLSQVSMKNALSMFGDSKDSLASRIWRSHAIKLALAFLPSQPAYSLWSLDKIRIHLESSYAVVLKPWENFQMPKSALEVIVIYGQVLNCRTTEVYQAPSLVPLSCSKISPVQHSPVRPQALLVIYKADHNNH